VSTLSLRLPVPPVPDAGNGNADPAQVRFPIAAPYFGPLCGIVLEREYDLSADLPPADYPAPRILDLGANLGLGTLFFSRLYPGARFVCVEPDPRNQLLLRKTLDWNGVEAQLIAAAAGAAPGRLVLRFGSNPTCSALEDSPMHDWREGEQVAVDVLTVPDILDRAGWDRVDLVKIDIEGSEDTLLSQSNDWLERVGAVVLEIHPNTTPEKIAGYLRPFGFHLRRLSHGTEPVYIARRESAGVPGQS
jgi:FkbM family methyltransferase